MSDFYRIKRLAKSLVPRFSRSRTYEYTLSDAHMMITDLGMNIPPEILEKLVSNDRILDDFLTSIYQLEKEIRQTAITEFATIKPELEPKVYLEDGMVGFTIMHKGEELVFAEYAYKKS
ncbi:MAG: hypothetical protein AAF587_22980 [Bacteroidota bacterium]